jgi:hypothetical protein
MPAPIKESRTVLRIAGQTVTLTQVVIGRGENQIALCVQLRIAALILVPAIAQSVPLAKIGMALKGKSKAVLARKTNAM